MTTVDILVVGAHPDDAEVGVGGLIHKMVTQGYSVGILDLTEGELASRGSPAERAEEARVSAEILGVKRRECAKLKDGKIANTSEQQKKLIPLLRSFRPKVLIAPMSDDRHPDHGAAHELVRDANYFAGLAHLDPDAQREPHRAMRSHDSATGYGHLGAHGSEAGSVAAIQIAVLQSRIRGIPHLRIESAILGLRAHAGGLLGPPDWGAVRRTPLHHPPARD